MNEEPRKLTEDEIKDINKIRQEYSEVQGILGKHSIDRILLEQSLERLEEDTEKSESEYRNIQEKERILFKNLSEKYGRGIFNLESGMFEPDERVPVPISDRK